MKILVSLAIACGALCTMSGATNNDPTTVESRILPEATASSQENDMAMMQLRLEKKERQEIRKKRRKEARAKAKKTAAKVRRVEANFSGATRKNPLMITKKSRSNREVIELDLVIPNNAKVYMRKMTEDQEPPKKKKKDIERKKEIGYKKNKVEKKDNVFDVKGKKESKGRRRALVTEQCPPSNAEQVALLESEGSKSVMIPGNIALEMIVCSKKDFHLGTYIQEIKDSPKTAKGSPTPMPTISPTNKPTESPTNKPSPSPTLVPTPVPTLVPTPVPTPSPSMSPTDAPTRRPSLAPTREPTAQPSENPTAAATNGTGEATGTNPTPSPTFLQSIGGTAGSFLGPTQPPTESPAPSAGPTIDFLEPGKYDDYRWSELPEMQQLAAETIGYSKKEWNKGEDLIIMWSELDEEQQIAAWWLEYDEFHWNEAVYNLIDAGYWDDYYWAEMPVEIQEGAGFLGYIENSWDNSLDVATTNLSWSGLNATQLIGAYRLGYDQESWDSGRRRALRSHSH